MKSSFFDAYAKYWTLGRMRLKQSELSLAVFVFRPKVEWFESNHKALKVAVISKG